MNRQNITFYLQCNTQYSLMQSIQIQTVTDTSRPNFPCRQPYKGRNEVKQHSNQNQRDSSVRLCVRNLSSRCGQKIRNTQIRQCFPNIYLDNKMYKQAQMVSEHNSRMGTFTFFTGENKTASKRQHAWKNAFIYIRIVSLKIIKFLPEILRFHWYWAGRYIV